jgi:hypothetical protein
MPGTALKTEPTRPIGDTLSNQWLDFLAARRRFLAAVNVQAVVTPMDDHLRTADPDPSFSPTSACRTPSRFGGPPCR